MLKVITPQRTHDRYGSGHFGASRGRRRHEGIDFAALPGSTVLAAHPGTVTKIGYPYRDDLSFRYVEITDDLGFAARYFYVEPEVTKGQYVMPDDPIGSVQSLNDRHPGITEHIHFEVRDPDGMRINPSDYLK